MRISVTRIAPRGGFSFAILAQTGLEPVQSFLTKGFSMSLLSFGLCLLHAFKYLNV